MEDKIKLKKEAGCIVFLGGMNAMPMMYALELKTLGYEVLYIVDAPASNTLSRPENHFKDIAYPYPKWIIEYQLKSQMLLPIFRAFFATNLKKKIFKKCSKVQAVFFNGFFTSLIPAFNDCQNRIALSHGSDLDSWADLEGREKLSNHFYKQSFFKYLPKNLAKYLIKKVVNNQYQGFLNAERVIYFPQGFNANGDRVLNSLTKKGVKCLERYDASFEPLKEQKRGINENPGKLVIFSGVRFTFKTFTEGNDGYSKGNDMMIEGLAKFYKNYPNIEIHFVEKGPDVGIAKSLINTLGLEKAVIWHKEMKFLDLLRLYKKSDICFDQVGKHWIGAIGFYALWLGKPLIANDELPVQLGVWPKDNPILSANTGDAVFKALVTLAEDGVRQEYSVQSMDFAERYLSPQKLMDQLFDYEF
ncbi:glycosyltransferase family protein [Thiomicrorhabdus chilensis]|uniref:glycosyltransferase n=1 Tax=Thiomicrorhabdus chilensis TaxID=63656 RepID=UPI0004254124|nr:glycosyltransferase [Thiomicrorhabdus chilensis]